jgi:predicted DsbA family dithiol-disulfide isomerase
MWGIEATVLLDESGEYARRLGVRGVPTNVVVDSDGTVRDVGLVRLDELERAVDRLVGRDQRCCGRPERVG